LFILSDINSAENTKTAQNYPHFSKSAQINKKCCL